jgi:hypothetical protein
MRSVTLYLRRMTHPGGLEVDRHTSVQLAAAAVHHKLNTI